MLRQEFRDTGTAIDARKAMNSIMSTPTPTDRASLQAEDAVDALASFRGRFSIPEGLIYLDGNSLGPLPRGAAERALEVINNEWGQGLIRSWNTSGWFELPSRLGDKLSKLIGGKDGETVVTDTTSLNLFKALASAVRIPNRKRASKARVASAWATSVGSPEARIASNT